ncbi:thiamine phosphate synthase [Egicoccus halophilus]|uniref:thiamine phosphate synthase n=1 Tax=Egicoccus halophilus TaxID=1670830 RepID=UPI00197AA66A|nr:thiamine phosphate synthase [Egicoccus halophilus]
MTDRRQARADLVDTLAAAVEVVPTGAADDVAVLLRDRDLPAGPRARLAGRLAERLAPRGIRLLIAGDPVLAARVGAAGVHLAAHEALPTGVRPGLLTRSCHDRDEVRAGVRDRLDALVVAPVAPTRSKPGHGPALGTGGVRRLATEAGATPVLALGGVDVASVPHWLAQGAWGVAVMGALMRTDAPDALVADLLAALAAAAPSSTTGARP